MACYPRTCLQALPGLVAASAVGPGKQPPGSRRSIGDPSRRPKAGCEQDWRAGRGHVTSPSPPAGAQGISGVAAASETLVLQRLLLDKAPDSQAGALQQPRKPEAGLVYAGRGLPAPEAVSSSFGVSGAARRSREGTEGASHPTSPALTTGSRSGSVHPPLIRRAQAENPSSLSVYLFI